MAFGFDAINTIRLNRALLKRRKFKDVKKIVLESVEKTEGEFKKVSTEELVIIKNKIRKDAQKTAKREVVTYGSLAIVLLLVVIYLSLQIIGLSS